MVEISSPGDLEDWLKDKPIKWTQVLACRIALRTMPLINEVVSQSEFRHKNTKYLTISVYRALLISGVAAYSSTPDISNVDARAASYAAADAARAVRAAYAAADAALSDDMQWLQTNHVDNNSPQQLLALPLWHDNQTPLNADWQELKQSLLALDPNWQFWVDWYQAKLDGTQHPGLKQAQQNDLYYKIATFPNNLWEEGAEAVNQHIAELMEEVEEGEVSPVEEDEVFDLELEPQSKGALQFKTNEEGIIELNGEVRENELLNDQDAKDRHSEVDYLATELISSYDPNQPSANVAKPIVSKVQRYHEALGKAPEEANLNFIIPRGEVLRQELEQEENRDEFTNSPPLPDNFKSALTSLVAAHNIYVLLDPVLDERDQARLGPDARVNLVSKNEGLKIVEGAFNEGLIEEEIVEVFKEEAETSHDIPDPESRQDRRFSENSKNLSRLLLSNAQKIAKKIKDNQADIIEVAAASGIGAGGVIFVTSASWTVLAAVLGGGASVTWCCFKMLQNVVKNEDFYLNYFNNKKEIKAFIEALKKLPLK